MNGESMDLVILNVKYNPNFCSKLITQTLCGMIDKGIWKKEDIEPKYKKYLK